MSQLYGRRLLNFNFTIRPTINVWSAPAKPKPVNALGGVCPIDTKVSGDIIWPGVEDAAFTGLNLYVFIGSPLADVTLVAVERTANGAGNKD
jgi:hypothetical protein